MLSKKIFLFFIGVFLLGFFLSNFFTQAETNSQSAVVKVFDETSLNCSSNKERTKYIVCYKKSLESAVRKYGLKSIMLELENRYLASVDFDQGGINQCHDVAHAIGQTAGAYSKNLNQTIIECPNICTSGCFHGVVEGAISTGYDILSNIDKLCDHEINGQKASTNSDCFHGLGHGVASLSGFDFIQALKYCDLIPETEGQRNCGAGVIMELYEPSSFDHAILEFPDDIAGFCKTLWSTYAETCFITAGTHTYTKNNSETDSIKACLSVPEQFKEHCVGSLGQNMFFVYQGNSQKISDFCAKIPAGFLKACFAGVIESSVMSDPLVRKGVEICQSFENQSKTCFDAIAMRMKMTNRLQRAQEICEPLTQDQKNICLESVKYATN